MIQQTDIDRLIEAVEKNHNCHATYVKDVPAQEKFNNEVVWEGLVTVFKVNHPMTDTCYAWKDGDGNKIYAVLKVPPVDSPALAVRAVIVHLYKEGKL